jgi:branched-subunit amino acid transport protein AzlD
MEKQTQLTHEKHLNHLVRVVPLLCLAYGMQSYMMMSFAKTVPTGTLVLLLGVSLAMSVIALVTYDNYYNVSWADDQFTVKKPWSWKTKTFKRREIQSIEVIGEVDQFQTVIVKFHGKKRITFYFVDNGYDFKKSMEYSQELSCAA